MRSDLDLESVVWKASVYLSDMRLGASSPEVLASKFSEVSLYKDQGQIADPKSTNEFPHHLLEDCDHAKRAGTFHLVKSRKRQRNGGTLPSNRTPGVASSTTLSSNGFITISVGINTGTILLSRRISATRLEVAHLLAIHALDAGHYEGSASLLGLQLPEQNGVLTVAGLGAILGVVAHLITVVALNIGHIARLGALLRHMTILTAVAATLEAGLWTVLGKVAHYNSISMRPKFLNEGAHLLS